MSLTWHKTMTKSDAQQDTEGAKMPFLRFTKGSVHEDHATYFRNTFFADAPWRATISRHKHSVEEAEINIHVTISGEDLGSRKLLLSHDPQRAGNNSAPTTHLMFDDVIRQKLESNDMTGHQAQVDRDDQGNYYLTIG